MREAAALAARVYEWSASGGNCHAVLDDDNLRATDILACRRRANENANGYPPDQIADELACLSAYLMLSKAERWSAQAVLHGYRDGEPGILDWPPELPIIAASGYVVAGIDQHGHTVTVTFSEVHDGNR